MSFSDETLMAYADGELDAETRRAIEQAMADDAVIAATVALHRARREQLQAAYAPVLAEPVPEFLISTAQEAPAAPPSPPVAHVVSLADARATRAAPAAKTTTTAATAQTRRRWSWPEWSSIAATLLLGLFAGRVMMSGADALVAQDGRVVAGSPLAQALSDQQGGTRNVGSPISIGVSFVAKSGDYCRTFSVRGASEVIGFACRSADDWRVQAMTQGAPNASATGYRMAGTALPPLIQHAVEDVIEGEPLDAAGEAAARQRGWKK